MQKIFAYGLSKEQTDLLAAALPEGYELVGVECVMDLLVSSSVCTIIDATDMRQDSLRTLLAYYMDVGDALEETVVWLGDVQLPRLPSFICCESFLELLTALDAIIPKAQEHYDTMQIYSGIPEEMLEAFMESEICALLHQKYGEKPDAAIVKRLLSELAALREVKGFEDLAAAYELANWLRKQNVPFFVEHITASGLIPYLLGITQTNPLPPHTYCLSCKTVTWRDDVKDGFDIPAATCPDCGAMLFRDGHDLVWQEYAGYGRLPTYSFCLPISMRDQIVKWAENHWRKSAWEQMKEESFCLDVGPFHFLFRLDENISQHFHHKTVTAEQKDALIRLAEEKMRQCDALDLPCPQNAAQAIAVANMVKSTGGFNDIAKHLLRGGLKISDLICCREDIYHYLCAHGFVEKDAFRGMQSVRKGRGFPVITDEMRNARDKWVLAQCSNICYLPSKAATLERMLFQIRSGFVPPKAEELHTGIGEIDSCIRGMKAGEVILVGARPGMGKRMFAKEIQRHLQANGKKVVYFDLIKKVKTEDGVRYDSVPRPLEEFEAQIRAEQPDIAILDRLSFLADYDKTDETAESLLLRIKAVAQEMEIPILVLADLSRAPENRPDPSPVTEDIIHGEKVLPLLDTVLLLYRRAYYDPLADRNTARCIIAKAKRCNYKIISLQWEDEKQIFEG